MKHKTPGITDELLLQARTIFLEKGYTAATLRDIASRSGVTANAFYNRFGDKAGLFDTLVKDSAEGLRQLISQATKEAMSTDSIDTQTDISTKGTYDTVDYIYDHFDDFRLIFCCSGGTKWEHYLEELCVIEEQAFREMRDALLGADADDFFIHVICMASYNELREIVAHDLSRDEAHHFMDQVAAYRQAGWKAILGQ